MRPGHTVAGLYKEDAARVQSAAQSSCVVKLFAGRHNEITLDDVERVVQILSIRKQSDSVQLEMNRKTFALLVGPTLGRSPEKPSAEVEDEILFADTCAAEAFSSICSYKHGDDCQQLSMSCSQFLRALQLPGSVISDLIVKRVMEAGELRKDRKEVIRKIHKHVDEDDALVTLAMTLLFLIMLAIIASSHLKHGTRSGVEDSLEMWLGGPELAIMDVPMFWSWVHSTCLPAIFSTVTASVPPCKFGLQMSISSSAMFKCNC